MADRARRLAAAVLIAAALSVVMPSAAWSVQLPGEGCPEVVQGTTPSAGCPRSGGGSNVGGLLPIIGAALGGAAIALGAAVLVFRRRAGRVAPIDPGEWWTCANCGRNNVIDSPRCYACGSWRT
jgi:hypothetical protein